MSHLGKCWASHLTYRILLETAVWFKVGTPRGGLARTGINLTLVIVAPVTTMGDPS